MDLELSGKVALVLGASKGIGYGIAEVLAREGATVAIASRSRQNISEAAKAIGAAAFVHDSTEPATAESLLRNVENALGDVSILVLNTGGPPVSPDPLSVQLAVWEAAHRSLLVTPITLLRLALPGMRKRKWGRVLSVSSTAVREPISEIVLSGAYRSALMSTLKVFARAVAVDGVTINSLLPGDIATDRLLDSFDSHEAAARAARQEIPVGRLGSPSELAEVAAFLCSDRAAFVTGTMLAVDGGRSAGV
jgi:3-oxoacyl-[acyl-carrier protein] reductase